MNFDDLIEKRFAEESSAISAMENSPASHGQDIETILHIVRKINTSLVLSDVLELVTDEAIRIAKAERGFLMLANADRKLEFVVGRNAHGESIEPESFQVSSSVLDDVFLTGESICIENALTDERFERRQSIMNLELQTIISSPVQTRDEKIGVIYVDSKFIHAIDKAEILNLFEILAGQAAIAIKNARLYENLKKTYEELKQANEMIIQSERMALKGELAAEISHELKNLVAVVLLNLEIIQKRAGTTTPEEIKGIVQKTIAGARKIEGFSKSLLTRSRAGSNLVPASLNKITGEFAELVKFLPKFRRNKVSATLAKNIPTVELDIDQVQQVLLNLVNNSIEACPEAAVELITKHDQTTDTVHLCVKDNGPGIDESIIHKLFTEKITTKDDGHGYGLPICRQIMENHGGSISVNSKPGEGAEFVLVFPRTGKQA